MNNAHAQFPQNSFPRQYSRANGQRTRGVVRQDKDMPKFQRVATTQPDPMKRPNRAERLSNDLYRSQNTSMKKWRAEKATTWLNPLVKNELERTAGVWGVSLSKVMAEALEEWVHQHIHKQHETLLYPIIRQIIREELRAFCNRIVFFLMRIAFASEQSRILITNILDRILRREGVTPQTFTTLVDKSNTIRFTHSEWLQ